MKIESLKYWISKSYKENAVLLLKKLESIYKILVNFHYFEAFIHIKQLIINDATFLFFPV